MPDTDQRVQCVSLMAKKMEAASLWVPDGPSAESTQELESAAKRRQTNGGEVGRVGEVLGMLRGRGLSSG
ncbi:MAG: hypothetical protein Q9200_002111 [Gallowayella weberi]